MKTKKNDDYVITLDSQFEGRAGVTVKPDRDMDAIRITLYGVNDCADIAPGDVSLYVELLLHAAEWIKRNAETVMARKSAEIYLADPDIEQLSVLQPDLLD